MVCDGLSADRALRTAVVGLNASFNTPSSGVLEQNLQSHDRSKDMTISKKQLFHSTSSFSCPGATFRIPNNGKTSNNTMRRKGRNASVENPKQALAENKLKIASSLAHYEGVMERVAIRWPYSRGPVSCTSPWGLVREGKH